MSREIKFRAWDFDSSEMLYTDKDNNRQDFFFSFSEGNLDLLMSVEDDYPENRKADIMQFTGLKDHKEVEIYENDLVLGYGKPHEVIFADGAFYLKNKNSHVRLSRTCGALEVIGNVFENPELLSTN